MKRLSNQSGSLVVALAIVGASIFAISAIMQMVQSQSHGVSTHGLESSFLRIEDKLRSLLLNELAWRNTLAYPANASPLDCIIDPEPDPSTCRTDGNSIAGELAIFRAEDDPVSDPPYYDANDPAAGFTREAQPCTGFDAVNGNDACPLRVEFDLTTHCEPGNHPLYSACSMNSLDIEIVYLYKPQGFQVFTVNAANRSFTVNREPATLIGPNRCWDLHGVYDDSVDHCSLSFRDISCPEGQAMQGFDGGEPVCVDL